MDSDLQIEVFFFFFFFRLLSFRGRHSGCFQTSAQKIWQCFTPGALPSGCNLLLIVGNLARPFNVLGCTLEGNELRHCAAKPIASGYHGKHKWVFTPVVL